MYIQAAFNISTGIIGSAKAHYISYSSDDSNLRTFINGSNGTYIVGASSTSCPTQSNINVSLTAVSVLGEGPPSTSVLIGEKMV